MMPLPIGNQSYTNLYNSSLRDRESVILDADINLYECGNAEAMYLDQKIFGLWDVRVSQDVGSNLQIRSSIRWFYGQEAYVQYRVLGKGRAVAYIPDDAMWHNRIMLSCIVGTPAVPKIDRYHTKGGFIDGARVSSELRFLRDLTHDYIVSHKTSGDVLYRSKDKEECEDYVRSRKDIPLKVTFGKSAPIQSLIDTSRSQWIFQPQWREEVLPQIKEQLKARFGDATETLQKESILRMFPQLKTILSSPVAEQILKSEAVVQPLKSDVDTIVPESNLGATQSQSESVLTGLTLPDLSLPEIRAIARDHNITIRNKSKDVLIDEIKEKMGIVEKVLVPEEQEESDFAEDA